ncbi:MAG TPA: DUF1080 domain-containing protein [Gemmatimonadales bacterium]|nr:DUF1080 domain-containing protein [Gemmatimonadales bacterium]
MTRWMTLGLLALVTGTAVAQETGMNTLTAAEKAAGWLLLFDGATLRGWRHYEPDRPLRGWAVVGDALTRTGPGGDIVTERMYRNFELSLEWMVEPGGNSGIFYRAAPGSKNIYHSAPEMQVLDDERHPDGQSPLTSAGANYGLHPAPRGVVRPAGEWNQVRLLVNGNQVEHWLNGTRVVGYELGSGDWKDRVAKSKFAEWPEYGQAAEGFIGLQDHGDRVAYRNIRIRVLP